MRKPRLIESRDVALCDIHIEHRLRPVDPVAAQALATSIEEIGLQDRIDLRKVKLKKKGPKGETHVLRLMAGAHRLDAFHRLGFDAIPADIWDCTDEYAALMEIDDNLARADLSPLDRAVFLVRRKAAYERMYPETMHGAKGLAAIRNDQTDIMSVWSFAAATAQQTGLTERQVRRLIAAAKSLSDADIEALRAAPKQVTIADLQTLAKCDPWYRAGIIFGLVVGCATSASEALDMMKARPGDVIMDPIDAKVRPLNDLFARSSKAVARRFVRSNIIQIRAILAEMEDTE